MSHGEDDEQGRTRIHASSPRPNPGGRRPPAAPDQGGPAPVFGGRTPEEVRRSIGLNLNPAAAGAAAPRPRPRDPATGARAGRPEPFGSDVPRLSRARGPKPDTLPSRERAGPSGSATTFHRTARAGDEISLTDAAAPALTLAVHAGLTHAQPDADGLHDRVTRELRAYQSVLRSLRLDPEIEREAHYVVCATIDDIVLNTPWGLYSVWGTQGMVSTFHRDVVSGERFFDLVGALQREPGRYGRLIDLVHTCLSLGFQGRLRVDPRGAGEHTRLREMLHTLIRARRDAPDRDLSPRWRGAGISHHAVAAQVPLWMIGAAAVVVLTLALTGFRLMTGAEGDGAASVIASLGTAGMAGQAAGPVPALPRTVTPQADQRLARLREGLRLGCPAARIELIAEDAGITLRLLESGLFAPGSATLQARFVPVVRCIASVIGPDGGALTVTGHTDNTPIRTLRFPSNWELSQARAKTVADIMSPLLSDRRRLSFEGRADSMPIAPNTAPQDRERNRRIDVMLSQGQP
jgi:type VI secretion system protein ImpK